MADDLKKIAAEEFERQMRQAIDAIDRSGESGDVSRSKKFWIEGFYYNPDDPRDYVDKLNGKGRAMNIAHPRNYRETLLILFLTFGAVSLVIGLLTIPKMLTGDIASWHIVWMMLPLLVLISASGRIQRVKRQFDRNFGRLKK
jgi:hypothetical protein